MKKVFALAVVVVVMLVGGIACATKITVPDEAQKLSDVVPAMGEHWANPANLPLGPIYVVYKGEVIGIEYMWSEDMMQDVHIPTPEGEEHINALVPLPVGATVDHVDVAFMEHGHEGFEVPHWDMHAYFITQAEKAAITP